MKNLITTIVILVTLITSSCGSKSDDSSGNTTQAVPKSSGCPSGSFISVNRFNTMYVGKTGLIAFEMNKCKSSGTISCDGNSFTMHIDAKDTVAMDLNECVGIGDFQCEYDTSSGNVITICPKGPTPNPFRSSMAWERN